MPPTPQDRRTRRTLGAALVAFLLLVVPAAVQARQSSDPRAERDRVREQAAEVAGRVDALQADEAEVSAALDELQGLVTAKAGQLEDAERAAESARRDEANARAAADEAREAIRRAEDELAAVAVEAYIHPPSADEAAALNGVGLSDSALRSALLDTRTDRQADVMDQLRAAREDLDIQLEAAEAASAEADAREAAVEERLAELEAARDQQAALAQQVEERVNRALAEAAALEELDAELSEQIAAEQAELAAQLRAQGDRAEAGGAAPVPPPSVGSTITNGSLSLTTVGGITVASSIAGQVQALLGAAAADGIPLSGSGYRDPQRQVELRMQNCGTSSYAVYQMPSSYCSPPTAIPGTSNHERGLAVDFANCSSRSTACYLWLAGNASRFGLYNLPSEPWHWSVNGG